MNKKRKRKGVCGVCVYLFFVVVFWFVVFVGFVVFSVLGGGVVLFFSLVAFLLGALEKAGLFLLESLAIPESVQAPLSVL